jgi:hypothetical protein
MTTRAQQTAALRLVSTGLSEGAYNAVSTIMGLDNVLARQAFSRPVSGGMPYPGRGPGSVAVTRRCIS